MYNSTEEYLAFNQSIRVRFPVHLPNMYPEPVSIGARLQNEITEGSTLWVFQLCRVSSVEERLPD